MANFLNFIFILVLIWLGFVLFVRYVFPRLLIYWVKRKQKKMMDEMGIKQEDVKKRGKKNKEGQVNIDKVPQKDKKGSTENLGEYVDFEEVDD